MKNKAQYAIRSLERADDNAPALFCAIHGYSPFFTRDEAKAKVFPDEQAARTYALDKLFTAEAHVFDIVKIAQPAIAKATT